MIWFNREALVKAFLLHASSGQRNRSDDQGYLQENEEYARTPHMVDERPTKHWTSLVVTLDEVSAECSCRAWRVRIDNGRDRATRIEQASAAARKHRHDSIIDLDA